MQVISELFAFIATEPMVGEGVVAVRLGDTFMPLIAADAARLASLRATAQQVANESGATITLARFTLREDVETLHPSGARGT